MLNFADLLMLLTVLVGPVSGFGAAHAHKAEVAAIVLFAVGGLGLGIALAVLANRWAYRALHSKSGDAGGLLAYTAIPFAGMLVAAVVPIFVAELVYAHS